MEKRKIKPILSLLLITLFLAACTFPTTTPTVPQVTQTESLQAGATEPATGAPATADGSTPVTGTGLCANTYYPVRQGATWSYTSTGGSTGPYSFTDTITSVREDGFTLSTQFNNLTRTQAWACKPEGLVALEFGGAPAAMLSAQNMQLDVQASNVKGVTLPSQVNAGDEWQHSLDLQGQASVANETGSAQGTGQNNFKALGMESVTVPAGTFNALKLQVNTNLNMTVSYQGLGVPVAFTGAYTYWFAPGVGWVKASGTGNGAGIEINESIELQSYNIP